ncbi:MAG: hypothetical protein U9P63_02055 [Patescibacteria group bacterium]|nr:hypothetical protein [Patescibacteria group bacterium]
MEFRDFLANFHIGAASGWDVFIVLIFLIAVFVYGFFLGRNRMIVLLLSTYFSFAIMQVFPWSRLISLEWLGIGEEPSSSLRILIFLGIILLFYFLIPRSVLSSTLRIKKRGDASWAQLFILSIAQVGLLAMILISFLSNEIIADLSSPIKKMLIEPEAQFVWIVIPILIMALMRRRKHSEGK